MAHVTLLMTLFGAPCGAASLWDGLWYPDEEHGKGAAHSCTFTKLANGQWKFEEGGTTVEFAMDGRPYPESNAPDFLITARLLSDDVLETVEAAYGRTVERIRRTLSVDGQTVTLLSTRIYPDGREKTSTATAVRVSGGTGIEGTWKEAPDDAPAKPQAAADNTPSAGDPRPYWVISTAPDGVMSWFIPATGELIRGKADGRVRPITGPQQPANRTFTWKRVAANRLDFYASDNGRLVCRAIEILSADGTSFTDTLWYPGHEDEKDVRVFVKR
jgi:hypothetical protein